MSRDDVTVVLPTLNEEEAIGKVVAELKQVGFSNILVVDGYSDDGTTKIAESTGCSVLFQHSRGKTGAIQTALEKVNTPYMLVMDGDCTYNPKDIDTFLAHSDRYDQIIGVRASGRENIPRLSRFGNWLINGTFNTLMGTKLSDVLSGMYLLKTDLARQLELKTKGFDVEVEIAAQVASDGRITEVPIAYRKRVGKRKLNSWRHGFQILRTILRLAHTYNPASFFAGLIALAAIPGLLLLGLVAFEALRYDVWNLGYYLTGLVCLVLAAQGLTIATVSLMLKRMEKRVTRQTNYAL